MLTTAVLLHLSVHLLYTCSLRMYNSLVERCFRDCVESFRRKDLDSTEEKVGTCRAENREGSVQGGRGFAGLASWWRLCGPVVERR